MKIFEAVVALCLTTANTYITVGPISVENIQERSLTLSNVNMVDVIDARDITAPYIVSLVSADVHICSGSLIGNKTVLTAAHCCYGKTASTLKVKYGGADRNNLPITNLVSQVIIHPQYYSNSHDYDYCILRLTNIIITSTTVQLISVASSRPADGTQAQLIGWDKTSGKLKKVNMTILSCNVNAVAQWMICATSTTASGCFGDSGAPLTVNGSLVGFVSWGKNGCASDTTIGPTVFADPVKVVPWLLSYTF